MVYISKRAGLSLIVFGVGLLLTIIAVQFPLVQDFITKLDNTGPIGAFIGGILYAFAFTSSLATALFLNLSDQLHPLLAAVVGGLGSAIYDISIFAFLRQQTNHGFLHAVQAAMTDHHQLPRWLSLLIGIIIIGSPLPDELAAGFFSFMKLSPWHFLGLSFVANTIGIYIITMLW